MATQLCNADGLTTEERKLKYEAASYVIRIQTRNIGHGTM
jgi:hypothetical protein